MAWQNKEQRKRRRKNNNIETIIREVNYHYCQSDVDLLVDLFLLDCLLLTRVVVRAAGADCRPLLLAGPAVGSADGAALFFGALK
jgi:hypothetical protein